MKKLLSAILVVFLMFTLCSCVSSDRNIDNYLKDRMKYEATRFMPSFDSLGDYKNIEYYSRKDDGLFPEYSMQLVVSYDEDTFLSQKQRLETAYTYLEEPQTLDGDISLYTIPVTDFSYMGFDFKVAVFDDTDYPKNFGMVGISEDNYEISYLWLYAFDLDFICAKGGSEYLSMCSFMARYFDL